MDSPEIKIGVLADRGAEYAQAEWQDTIGELTSKIPDYRFGMMFGSLSDLSKAVANHQIDFLITNPGHFFELQVDYGASSLATAQDLDGAPPTSSTAMALIVLADQTDILNIEDLKNHSVAAASPDAFSYHIAAREFLDHGFDLTKQASLIFTGIPTDSVVSSVLAGKASGGIVRACALEKMIEAGQIKPGLLRVIAQKPSGLLNCQVSSRLYPGWTFVKTASAPASLAYKVGQVLLNMQPGSTNSFWTAPVDNDSVQELYRALKIGPYERFRTRGILDFLWENRYWVGILSAIAAWWIIHVFRVEYLIARRSRELQEAHDQARIRGEQMEHAVRLSLLGEMASSLAHEINQPVAAILNYARGCERRLESGVDDMDLIRQGVRNIATQAERAGAIVRQMRSFVKKRPLAQIDENLSGIIEDTMLLFEPVATGKNIKVEIDMPQSLPLVRVDRVQIEEVLLNLLQNAAEATALEAMPRVVVKVLNAATEITVSVIDNGPGLEPENEAHLFEAFYTTKPSGLGLGLSLSRTIVEAHGGRLWVDTYRKEGTVFSFTLPTSEQGDECPIQQPLSTSSMTTQPCGIQSDFLSPPLDTHT